MKKVSVTYRAPKGDSKVVEIWGHTFFDGKPEEVTVDERTYEKMSHHGLFECGKATDVDKPVDPPQSAQPKEQPKEKPVSQERTGSYGLGGSEKK